MEGPEKICFITVLILEMRIRRILDISPAFGTYEGFPPVLLQVGSEEVLLSDTLTVAGKLKRAHRKVRLSVYDGMFHVFQMAMRRDSRKPGSMG